jgi:hypothetical protein
MKIISLADKPGDLDTSTPHSLEDFFYTRKMHQENNTQSRTDLKFGAK